MLWFDDGSRVWCPSKFILIGDETYLLHIIKHGTKAYPITMCFQYFCHHQHVSLATFSWMCQVIATPVCVCVCFCPIIFFIHMWVPFSPFVLGPAFWHRYEIVTVRIHSGKHSTPVPNTTPKNGGSSTQQNLMFRTCRPTSLLGNSMQHTWKLYVL